MKDVHKAIIGIVSFYGVIAIFMIVIILSLFKGCSQTYKYAESEDGKMGFGVSKPAKDAFCMYCRWDGGEMKIVIPDEINGYKVTSLGGYTGRGVPHNFDIIISPEALGGNKICSDYYLKTNYNYYVQDGEYEDIYLYVYLGKNIEHFKEIYVYDSSFLCYVADITENEGEEAQIDIIYKVFAYYIVDDGNQTYYSKDGKVYYKEDDKLALGYE